MGEEMIGAVPPEVARKKIEIFSRWGVLIWSFDKPTVKEAVEEASHKADLREADLSGADLNRANLCGANLRGAKLREANLCGANLHGADLMNVGFYGKGGSQMLKKDQVEHFLAALGFVVEE
jgi:hypothetical protein